MGRAAVVAVAVLAVLVAQLWRSAYRPHAPIAHTSSAESADVVLGGGAALFRVRPARVLYPRTEHALAGIVRGVQARRVAAAQHADGGRAVLPHVKVVGGGHSFSPIAVGDDTVISLRDYAHVLRVQRWTPPAGEGDADGSGGAEVEVQAGVTLARLCSVLDALGLALPTLGTITEQSLAGALATATHGSGLDGERALLGASVRALRVVLGNGTVVACNDVQHADIYRASLVGVGVAGIVSTVTLHVPARYAVRTRVAVYSSSAALERDLVAKWFAPAGADDCDHVKVWWLPFTEFARVACLRRVPEAEAHGRQPGAVQRFVRGARSAIAAALWDGVVRLPSALARPSLRAVNALLALAQRSSGDAVGEVSTDWVDAFTERPPPTLVGAEYYVPVARLAEALRAYRAVLEAGADDACLVNMVVEIRHVGAWSAAFLSPTGDGPRATINMAMVGQSVDAHARCMTRIEAALAPLGARPHWGKRHGFDWPALAAAYGTAGQRIDAFRQTVCRVIDVHGVFRGPADAALCV